ncbi:MAG: hypothetical protein VKK04_11320 [Synechococcales bacterium]|nr:hypothetical protein [Synechococcales bacterium]
MVTIKRRCGGVLPWRFFDGTGYGWAIAPFPALKTFTAFNLGRV